MRAARDLAQHLAEAGGEDGPEVAHSRAEFTRLRAHTADHPAGSPTEDRTRARVVHASHLRGQRWLQFWLQLR